MSGQRERPADLDEGLRTLLDSARDDYEPSAQQRAAVRRRLVQRLSQNPGNEFIAGSSKSAAISVSIGKLGLIATGLALAAAGFWRGTKTENPPNVPRSAATAPEAIVASAPTEAPSLQHDARADQDESRNKLAAHQDATHDESQRPRLSAKRVSYRSGRERRAAAETTIDEPASSSANSSSNSAAASVEPAVSVSAETSAADTKARGASAQPSAAPVTPARTFDSAPPATVEPSSPASELTLMNNIQSALNRGDAERAYALTAQHAARWPTGLFQEEREAARAIASCQLQLPAATKRARAFLKKYPQSALSPRVRSECTGAKD